MTFSIHVLPFKMIKVRPYRIIYTLLYLSSDRKLRIYMTQNSYNPHIAQVGNMTLLANPGKPGFYVVGLSGRVILCQPCSAQHEHVLCA